MAGARRGAKTTGGKHVFDPIAQLEKLLAHLDRQRAALLAEAAKIEGPQIDERLQPLLEHFDRVQQQLEEVRPRAEQLKKRLSEMKQHATETRLAAVVSAPPPLHPDHWPLSEAQIYAAIQALVQRARVPPLAPKAPLPALGDVQDMKSDSWASKDDSSAASSSGFTADSLESPKDAAHRKPSGDSDVQGMRSDVWNADDEAD